MSNLDTELRRLAEAIVAQAPDPPGFADLTLVDRPRTSRRTRRVVVSAVLVLAAIAVVLAAVLLQHDAAPKRVTTPASDSRYDEICRDDPGYFTNSNGETFGPSTPPDFNGEITPEMIASGPEFVTVGCGDNKRIAGWIKADDILQAQRQPVPSSGLSYTVYDSDGTTILGHWYLTFGGPCGFVRVGEEPKPCPPGVTVTGRTPSDVHG